MADLKISQLTGATTPLAGTEVLPVVQGGATRQVSVENLTTGRALSATEMTLSTGNLVVSNGKGIDFSATPGTGTSELLADYEEGTFTPGLTVASGSLTYAVQGTPKYTKVGRLVNAGGYINVSVANLPSGALTITGLPYSSAGFAAVTLTLFTGGFTTTYSGYLSTSGTSITIPNLNASIMVGGENIMFSATYSAA